MTRTFAALAVAIALAALLSSCATRTVAKESCAPQFPPGPCVDGPQVPPQSK